MLIVGTVPHTGSHFLINMLEENGYSVLPKDEMMRHAVERNQRFYRFQHVYDSSMDLLTEYGRIAPVISPLRHPMSVAQSWKNRGKPIVKQDVHAPMIYLFHNLIELAQRVRVSFLPLDMPCRGARLNRVSEIAGRSLRTRWAYYGPGPVKPDVPLTEDDKAAVDELMTHPFFQQHYGVQHA